MNSIGVSDGSDSAVQGTVDMAPVIDASSPHVVACIVGPTAAGKSALALQLAREARLSIVSADSRQVYRGFDIGTAKPSAAERALVPHYGVDVTDPTERYSAHRWATEARLWCEEAHRSAHPAVIVGGTGLYVRALVEPLANVPELDAPRRVALEPLLTGFSREELQRWCQRLDPARAHLGRTQQLRAVETALLAGQRLSDALRRPPGDSPATDAATARAHYLVVDPGPVLATRIAERVHTMVANGFIEEIERLREHVPPDAPAWNASGYGAMRAVVEGTLPLATAIERVIIETRQYAKRQRTWFRHQLPADAVTIVNPLHPDAFAVALRWWESVTMSRWLDEGEHR